MRPPFADAFDPRQPRGKDGKWIPTGQRIESAADRMGQNVAHHERLFKVDRVAQASAIIGRDVQGYHHAVSNQSLTHALKNHGNPAIEAARGQVALTRADFAHIPSIIRQGTYHAPGGRPGSSDIEIRARIGDRTYVYQAKARKGPRRLDMVTMWKK